MLKKLIKKIIWEIKGGYNPKKFWERWSDTFITDPWQVRIHPQHIWLLKKVRQERPDTILEIGCGFGRNIKFLLKHKIRAQRITGLDISKKMIHHARKYINDSRVNLVVCDAGKLPFKNKQFELIFTHGVLMHVKKDHIRNVIDEMKRVCLKSIICIEQNYNGNEYTFVHDYKKLFSSRNIKIVEYIHNKKLGLDYLYAQVR